MSNTENDNWHYASKTATMLMQTIAHIELSMHEGEASISTVIKTFNTMGEYMDSIEEGVQELADSSPELGEKLTYVRSSITEAIINMQFYDALTQRLQTVIKGLGDMSVLVDDGQKRDQESSWEELQQNMRSSCSIHSDTVFLEAICAGKGFEEAHRLATKAQQDSDEIELF